MSKPKIIVKLLLHPDGPHNVTATFATDITWMVDKDDNLGAYKGDDIIATFASGEWEYVGELIK